MIYILFLFYLLANMLLSRPEVLRQLRHLMEIFNLGRWAYGYPFSCVVQFIILLIVGVLSSVGNADGRAVRKRNHKSLIYSLAAGFLLLVYSAYSFVFQYQYALAEGYSMHSSGTIFYSTILFMLVAMTEEKLFRGIIADKLFIKAGREGRSASYASLMDSAGFLSTGIGLGYPEETGEYPDDDHYKFQVWKGILISAGLFALTHALNFGSAYFFGVLIQILGAFVMGIYLAAVYFRTRNLSAVIFLHFINDISAAMLSTIFRMESGLADIVGGYGLENLIVLLPFLLASIYLLRKDKIMESRRLWSRSE